MIEYRITAVPSRYDHAVQEAAALNEPLSSIYLDVQRKGNIWNKFRVYHDILHEGKATHICLCDDDIVFVPNFKDCVQTCVDRFPDCIFTFYNSAVGKHGSYRFWDILYMAGASCVIPVRYLDSFLRFYDENLAGFGHDDTSMSIYALLHDIHVYLVEPKLVDTFCGESITTLPFQEGRIQPRNKGFQDMLVDTKLLKTAPVIQCRRPLRLHLPWDSEIGKACKDKIKERYLT